MPNSSPIMRRCCAKCGGSVYSVKQTSTLIDSNGVEHTITGLGTWHCSNACKDRIVPVVQYVGNGKEDNIKPVGQSFVVRDEYMIAVPRQRHITVQSQIT